MKALLLGATAVVLAACQGLHPGEVWVAANEDRPGHYRPRDAADDIPDNGIRMCSPVGEDWGNWAPVCTGAPHERPFRRMTEAQRAELHRANEASPYYTDAKEAAFKKQWQAQHPREVAEAKAAAEYVRQSRQFWAEHDPCWAYFGTEYCAMVGRH